MGDIEQHLRGLLHCVYNVNIIRLFRADEILEQQVCTLPYVFFPAYLSFFYCVGKMNALPVQNPTRVNLAWLSGLACWVWGDISVLLMGLDPKVVRCKHYHYSYLWSPVWLHTCNSSMNTNNSVNLYIRAGLYM